MPRDMSALGAFPDDVPFPVAEGVGGAVSVAVADGCVLCASFAGVSEPPHATSITVQSAYFMGSTNSIDQLSLDLLEPRLAFDLPTIELLDVEDVGHLGS